MAEVSRRRYKKPAPIRWLKLPYINLGLLHDYASMGDVNNVREVLDRGDADIDGVNGGNGMTALHWACMKNHIDVVRLLLHRKAQTDILDYRNNKPVDLTENVAIKRLFNVGLDLTDKERIKMEEMGSSTSNERSKPGSMTTEESMSSKDRRQMEELEFQKLGIEREGSLRRSMYTPMQGDLILLVRVKDLDEDFDEIELDNSQISIEGLREAICIQYDCTNAEIRKIRLLPHINITKTSQIHRLKQHDKLEVFLVRE